MEKQFSKILPKDFQADNIGACIYATYLLAENNIKRGFTDFKVVTGELCFTDRRGVYQQCCHRWIELANGEIYDPTVGQFWKFPYSKQPAPTSDLTYCYKHYNVYPPEEVLEDGLYLTQEFIEYHYKPTGLGQYFQGIVWQSEVDKLVLKTKV